MAEDSKIDGLVYFMEVPERFLNDLTELRSLDNLKLAYLETTIWLTGFTKEQAESVVVASLPQKRLYVQKGMFLHLPGKVLPQRRVPSGLLWTPIVRALKLQSNNARDNFRGSLNVLPVQIQAAVQSATIPAPVMMRVDMGILNAYMQNASRIRYKHLRWCILDSVRALVYGEPQLPIPSSSVYWQKSNSLLPLGFEFRLRAMSEIVEADLRSSDHFFLWEPDSSYVCVPKGSFRPLSLGGLRGTLLKAAYSH